MSGLPKCLLCGAFPVRLYNGDMRHRNRQCSLRGMGAVTAEQWTALMGGGEPVAYQFYDPATAKWHNFINDKHRRDTADAGYEIRALYTSPQAAQVDDAVLRKNEKRIASDEWIAEFFRFAPDGGWNNFNNWILNDYFKAGISGQQAARHFYSTEL